MSKKLAEGIDALVLDIKTGSGAFMRETSNAIELANSLINTAKAFNKKVIGFITDMNQPLGNYIGNWLEVYESVKVLKGEIKGDLLDLSMNLSGAMIYLGGKSSSINEGVEISQSLINNGKAFEKFCEMVKAQNGKVSYIENLDKYPKSKVIEKVYSNKSGYIKEINTFRLGMAALDLGAGRMKKEDKIEPKAGIIFYPKIGDKINAGDLIAEIRCESEKNAKPVKQKLNNILEFSESKVSKPELIKKIIN
jgi:pyrimidine-nucleoside phosphorylase